MVRHDKYIHVLCTLNYLNTAYCFRCSVMLPVSPAILKWWSRSDVCRRTVENCNSGFGMDSSWSFHGLWWSYAVACCNSSLLKRPNDPDLSCSVKHYWGFGIRPRGREKISQCLSQTRNNCYKEPADVPPSASTSSSTSLPRSGRDKIHLENNQKRTGCWCGA